MMNSLGEISAAHRTKVEYEASASFGQAISVEERLTQARQKPLFLAFSYSVHRKRLHKDSFWRELHVERDRESQDSDSM